MPHEEFTEETCIIVVDVSSDAGVNAQVGIIVDTVCEVLDIAGEDIEPAPEFAANVDTSFILGMGKVEEAVKILLDIDKVLTSDELSLVREASRAAEDDSE